MRPAGLAVVSLGCGIAAVIGLAPAGVLAERSVLGALAACAVAFVLGLVAFVWGAVAHARMRAGRGTPVLAAIAGWTGGLAGILIGPFLSYYILLSLAWKAVSKP